jgi:acyl carrier protein
MTTAIAEDRFNDPLFNEFVMQIATALKKSEVDPSATLIELGASSLNIVEIVVVCVDLFPELEDPDELTLDEFTTLNSLYEEIRTKIGG